MRRRRRSTIRCSLGSEWAVRRFRSLVSKSAVPQPLWRTRRMALGRYLFPAIVASVVCAGAARAQGTGTITGRVLDSTSQQGIGNVNIVIMGAQRGTLSRDDG